jgi:hypothetical protein
MVDDGEVKCSVVRRRGWSGVYATLAQHTVFTEPHDEATTADAMSKVRFNIAKAELELYNWQRRKTNLAADTIPPKPPVYADPPMRLTVRHSRAQGSSDIYAQKKNSCYRA